MLAAEPSLGLRLGRGGGGFGGGDGVGGTGEARRRLLDAEANRLFIPDWRK